MRPDDGRVVSNFIVQALRASPSPSTATAARPAASATSTTRCGASSPCSTPTTSARSTSATPTSTPSSSWPSRCSRSPGASTEIGFEPLPDRRPGPAAPRHHPGPHPAGLGARGTAPAGPGPDCGVLQGRVWRGTGVSAVIVNYNAGDHLLDCVRSLRADGVVERSWSSTTPRPTARRRRVAGSAIRTWRCWRPAPTSASARPPTGAWRPCRGDYVLILNPDTVVEPGTVKALAEALDRDPLAVVGPRIENLDGILYPSARRVPRPLASPPGTPSSGWCGPTNRFTRRYRMLDWDHEPARRRRLGVGHVHAGAPRRRSRPWAGSTRRYFMYVEDVDLCWRLWRAGWRVGYEPGGRVVHTIGGSSRADALPDDPRPPPLAAPLRRPRHASGPAAGRCCPWSPPAWRSGPAALAQRAVSAPSRGTRRPRAARNSGRLVPSEIMGKASSSKKVARAARTGGGRTRRGASSSWCGRCSSWLVVVARHRRHRLLARPATETAVGRRRRQAGRPLARRPRVRHLRQVRPRITDAERPRSASTPTATAWSTFTPLGAGRVSSHAGHVLRSGRTPR